MMGGARLWLPKVEDIGFWKLCGSGTGEGFTPIPNTSVYAILSTWPDQDIAHKQVKTARIFRKYRDRAIESWSVHLTPISARGAWSGDAPFKPADDAGGPLAALTRATVRLPKAMRFWKRVPKISDVIGDDSNVAFKIGIGEVPLLHQITFSIWPDEQAMADFARTPSGPHAKAIKAVRSENWFSEELYARFRVCGEMGTWNGASPLAHLEPAA